MGFQLDRDGEAAIARIDLQTKEGKKRLVNMDSKIGRRKA
jgi:hypothetical protein